MNLDRVFLIAEEVGALHLKAGHLLLVLVVYGGFGGVVFPLPKLVQDQVKLVLVVDAFESGKRLLDLILGQERSKVRGKVGMV